VVMDQKTLTVNTPVYFEFDPARVTEATGAKIKIQKDSPAMKALIQRGLRAELELQSFVTGQLAIALAFRPGTPVRLTGLSPDHAEMPTVPGSMEKLSRTIEGLPIDELVATAKDALAGVRDLVRAPEIKATLKGSQATVEEVRRAVQRAEAALGQTLTATGRLASDVNAQVGPLAKDVREALAEVRTTVARLGPVAEEAVRDIQRLARNVDGQVGPMAATVEATGKDVQRLARNVDGQVGPMAATVEATGKDVQRLARNLDEQLGRLASSVDRTLADMRRTLATVDDTLAGDTAAGQNLVTALAELAEAARSIRALAEYLERKPDALVFGK
jgi:paraquat-inducible protein B